jgi:hypothetical protein
MLLALFIRNIKLPIQKVFRMGKSRDENVGAYRILFRVPTQNPDFKMPV